MITDEVRQNWPVAAAMEEQNGDWITGGAVHAGQLGLYVHPGNIVAVCQFLKDSGYRLSGITGVDWHPLEPRFEIVYLLHSIKDKARVRIKCKLHGDAAELDSVTGVWAGADWYERETWDLFGVRFNGHPNLTRLMMPDTWEGHPLRKDFPVHGHRYSYADEGNVI